MKNSQFNKVTFTKKLNRASAALFSVFFAFLIVLVITLIIPGFQPGTLFASFFIDPFKNSNQILRIVFQFSAFLIGSIAVLLCYRLGYINLNIAGQMALTGLVIYVIGRNLENIDPNYNWLPLLIIVGLTAAILMSLFLAVIRLYFGVNEVLSGIFLNYIVYYIYRAVVKYSGFVNSDSATETKEGLNNMIGFNYVIGTIIPLSLLFAVFIFFVVGYLIYRTQFGFKINIIGKFPLAIKYAGINKNKIVLQTFFISGLLAGIAGIFYYYRDASNTRLFIADALPANGFDTLTIVWLAQASFIFIPLTTIFITWMRVQTLVLPNSEIPRELVEFLIGLILLFTAFTNSYFADPILRNRVNNSWNNFWAHFRGSSNKVHKTNSSLNQTHHSSENQQPKALNKISTQKELNWRAKNLAKK